MIEWVRDLRYGLKMLLKRPGASAIAALALGLGIGLTAMMFSIIEGAILRGLPFPDGRRLMRLERVNLARSGQRQPVPPDDLIDWQTRVRSFDGLAGYREGNITLSGDSAYTQRYDVARVTTNLFRVLRVSPVAGRDFSDGDGLPHAPPVAIISYGLWTARYGADPQAVGRTALVDGTLTTIVGVAPPKFGFPQAAEVWLPEPLVAPVKRGDGTWLSVVGRLNSGMTEARASAELVSITQQLAVEHAENKNFTATLGPYVQRSVPARLISTFSTMLGAVFGVLLIACVNVTNLQLARAMERTREMAIRTALGSGRWRVARQLLIEGLLLAVSGSLVGLAIAQAGTMTFMRAIADTRPPFWIDVRLDLTVLAFVVGVTATAGLVSSLLPAWRVAREDVNAILKDDARGTTSLRMGRFSRALVIVEVTASCGLLVVSGLIVRSILATSRLDYPFPIDDVFVAQISIDQGLRTPADIALEFQNAEQRFAAIPGVRVAALANGLPGRTGDAQMTLEGKTSGSDAAQPRAGRVIATPSYFSILHARASAGRLFNADDRLNGPPVAVVDESFVRRYLGGGGAIGRRFRFGAPDAKTPGPWMTVIGVVPSRALSDDSGLPPPVVYVPLAQTAVTGTSVFLSTPGNPLALTGAVRDAMKRVDDRAPVAAPDSLEAQIWKQGWAFRVFGGLFVAFGMAALVLASVGLYGVMAFSVRRRTAEIGVRLALGAGRGRVLRMILWQGTWRVAVGVALGLVPGWYLGKLMTALLSHVDPADPVVHGLTAITLLAVGALACLAPALRAASVDPLSALRHD